MNVATAMNAIFQGLQDDGGMSNMVKDEDESDDSEEGMLSDDDEV